MEDDLKKAATHHDSKGRVRGHYAVDPSGHLVSLRPGSSLTDSGWRWATKEDHEKAAAIEAARANAEADAAAAASAKQRAEQEAREKSENSGRGPLAG